MSCGHFVGGGATAGVGGGVPRGESAVARASIGCVSAQKRPEPLDIAATKVNGKVVHIYTRNHIATNVAIKKRVVVVELIVVDNSRQIDRQKLRLKKSPPDGATVIADICIPSGRHKVKEEIQIVVKPFANGETGEAPLGLVRVLGVGAARATGRAPGPADVANADVFNGVANLKTRIATKGIGVVEQFGGHIQAERAHNFIAIRFAEPFGNLKGMSLQTQNEKKPNKSSHLGQLSENLWLRLSILKERKVLRQQRCGV